ncbi:unnamed protein product [Paramecium octaurelia]|uniref:Protein kinase domain-containing protein n=1 Tax=Paramecium octaurelia TaxID=43137 RepID=A0A8S1YH40_PAROT|nr:unnamed protein product [Paramecium octaurelia]
MKRLILDLVQNNNYSSFRPTLLVNDDRICIRARNDQNQIEEIKCKFDLIDFAIQWKKNRYELLYGFRVYRQQSRYKVTGESNEQLMMFKEYIKDKVPISIKLKNQYEKVQEEPTFFQENCIIVEDKSTKQKHIMQRIYKKLKVTGDEFKIQFYLKKNPHPNILKWNSHCVDQKKQYISLDYFQYVTLDKIFQKYEKVPLETVREFMRQILQVLEHLHSKDIMHKDIKPENIIITNFDKPQIQIGVFDQAVLSQESCRFGGTIFYRPPEVIEGYNHTNKFDIYSAGVVFYGLLKNKWVQRRIHLQRDCAKLQQLEVDPAAVDLVKQMLHHDPQQRLDVVECLDHHFFIDEKPCVGNAMNQLFQQSIIPRFMRH